MSHLDKSPSIPLFKVFSKGEIDAERLPTAFIDSLESGHPSGALAVSCGLDSRFSRE